ncbi:putative rhamnogalacturonate lyase C [Lachnellula occidentalis]|uniref:Putative rhamnogalacturonate lyase C n=1 Tax=Lachnellula occidentalis TaxID=215460 RepID=A0A8H8RTJ2_9HELO|nr:putative rhamnogalacturonate lyase C [Lachnellula occidentalis]
MSKVFRLPPSAGEISRPFISSRHSPHPGPLESIANKLRSWTLPVPSTSKTDHLTCIICISDTHNTKPSLPEGDILLHAGDLSQYGLFDEIQAQLDWLNAQPHRYKIIIAGNHDLILDEKFVKAYPDRELDKPGKSRTDLTWGGITYLHNSSVEVECNGRKLKIYGSPMTPKCGNFGFQYDPDEDIWAGIRPKDTDIVLTHGPPAVHLDEGKGCRHLLTELWSARPKLVVFGHIHGGRGEERFTFDRIQECYENILMGVRPWINIFRMILCTISQVLSRTTVGSTLSTHFVNAAVVDGPGNRERREPVVAYQKVCSMMAKPPSIAQYSATITLPTRLNDPKNGLFKTKHPYDARPIMPTQIQPSPP